MDSHKKSRWYQLKRTWITGVVQTRPCILWDLHVLWYALFLIMLPQHSCSPRKQLKVISLLCLYTGSLMWLHHLDLGTDWSWTKIHSPFPNPVCAFEVASSKTYFVTKIIVDLRPLSALLTTTLTGRVRVRNILMLLLQWKHALTERKRSF